MLPSVSIVIASFNMGNLIGDTLHNCMSQTYSKIEIIVYDDHSSDNTADVVKPFHVQYIYGEKNVGVGKAFNAGIAAAVGDIVILMCADDFFADIHVVEDIVAKFHENNDLVHVSRWYFQCLGDDIRPLRAWRGEDPLTLANNPSGLAFRRSALEGCKCSNRMFIETTQLVSQVLNRGGQFSILEYDAVAVRVHSSTSTKPEYWLRRCVSSPVMDWHEMGGDMTRDYVSLIQIKNNFRISAVCREIVNFIKLRPSNIIRPDFWFFAIVALIVPRFILRNVPSWYRENIGRKITKEVKRK